MAAAPSSYTTAAQRYAALEALRKEPDIAARKMGNGHTMIVEKPNSNGTLMRFTGINAKLKEMYHSSAVEPTRSDRTVAYLAAERKEAKDLVETKAPTRGLVGTELGSAVDEEVGYIVRRVRRTNESMMTLCEKMDKGAAGLSALHPRTKWIVRLLAEYNFQPIAAQLGLRCTGSRMATWMDLLCWDPLRGCWIPIELKTGFSGEYKESDFMMKVPFAMLKDSNYNRHALQCDLTAMLFKETFNLPTLEAANIVPMIFKVDAIKAASFKIQDDFRELVETELYRSFILPGSFAKLRKQRKTIKAKRVPKDEQKKKKRKKKEPAPPKKKASTKKRPTKRARK
jgi:hypothetical protein